MAKEIDIVATLESDMRFRAVTEAGYSMHMDMETADGLAAQPMEMLLVGLAGCAGMSNLLILRKRKQDVQAYEIRIHGTRATPHPQVFVEITVEHVITGKGLNAEIVERAMDLTEQKYCGASVMLEKTAHIQHTYRLVELE